MRSHRLREQSFPAGRIAALAVLGAALATCGGTGFDRASIVRGLRILAVQKDPAGPQAGEPVKLTMLYWDGKRSQSQIRPIQITWFGDCINPEGDLYYACFENIEDWQHGAVLGATGDHGSTYATSIPQQILKPIPPEQGAPYGLVFVFFAACAGQIRPIAPENNPNTLPVGCFGPDDQLLGPEDFVPGYTSIYVYGDRRNANPIVGNLLLDGGPIGSATGPAANPPRIARCTSSDSAGCPAHPIKVEIDPSSAEPDPGAVAVDGTQLREQLWVSFYATGGDFQSEVRLVNDARAGWNDDNGTGWRVPSTPGPVRLWGIVHDNRGGVAWTEGSVVVE